uniref:HTH Mu-type domain-containing protein n=1 Tax=Syphacia muris TaxID=451379 RepID=A0A0N5AFP1_9BILA
MALRSKYLEYKRSKSKKDPLNTPLLIRNALKLAMAMSGQNTSDFEKKTVKFVSPRLFSIVPDNDKNDVNLLSPSLFSLHDSGSSVEKKFSVPKLLESIKLLKSQDREEIVDLIAEATGVSDAVEKAEEVKAKTKRENLVNARGIDGQPMYFTKDNATEIYGQFGKSKIETFEELHKSLSKQQLKEMNRTGYSLLSPEQLQMLYGNKSPYGSSKLLEKFLRITPENKTLLNRQKFRRNKRTVVLSPTVLTWLTLVPGTLSQAFVLSPVLLSPVILSPAVLGPFILSPWLFVPVILSPRVLSPVILSPLGFSPVILSPLALHPFILSPGIFNPFILSPNVLSPFILSPQFATPFILSPLCLSPLIFNPMMLSPLVLSPFVLSPLICSPQHLFALVGSPHALSPKISSQITASAVVASPSFLS